MQPRIPAPGDLACLRGLVEGAAEILGWLDGEGRVVWLNPAGERAFGRAAAGVRLAELVPEPEARGVSAALARCARGERPDPLRVKLEGEPALLLDLGLAPASSAAASAGSAQPARILLFGRDATELERAQRAQVQLLAALERMGEGASQLAHDIKNPIAALNLALRAVGRHLGVDEQEVVEDLGLRLVRLERTLRRTIGFARPIELEAVHVRCEAILERALAELGPELSAPGASLERRIEADLECTVDPERVAEALALVVRNALEAVAPPPSGSDRGSDRAQQGRGPRVRISARSTPAGLVIEVEDAGPGLAPSVRRSLFQPFASTKEAGCGLGLALAQRLIQAHGGRIEVGESELGGARFSLHLPQEERT